MIANASYRKQRAPGTLSSEIDAVNGEVRRDFDINPYSYALNTSRVLDPNEFYTRNYADFNILHELDNNYMDFDVTDLKFQGEFKFKPVAGLELSALGAVKYSQTSQQHTITDFSNQALAYRAMPTYGRPNTGIPTGSMSCSATLCSRTTLSAFHPEMKNPSIMPR